MDFSILTEASPDLRSRLKDVNDISDYLAKELEGRSYGSVNSCFITLHCISPKIVSGASDFKTGLVIDKKFTKSSGLLGFTVKLNFSEVTSGQSLKDLIVKALTEASSDLKKLQIKDFDVDGFIKDIQELLSKPGVKFSDYGDNMPAIPAIHEPKEFPSYVLMDENDFWSIIHESLESDKNQFKFLIDYLLNCDVMQIIGFECRLRTLIMESYHYNVLALHKIISELISDDDFLYFRCNLILLGKDVFRIAIENPEGFKTKLALLPTAEPLLAVSDEAFFKKLGRDTHQESPSAFASQFLDYSIETYHMAGDSWKENELSECYPTLWHRYRPIN